jgi:outer membrane protein OmpA-like peptidoglycan-associated protein
VKQGDDFMKKLLSALAVLALSSCATMTDQDGGLTEDHSTTVNKCGVGNYIFRHLSSQCGAEEKPVVKAEEKAAPAAAPVVKSAAKLVDNKIEISEEVKFQTGKSVIAADSQKVLDDVSKVIVEHKEKISMITIEGHTDHMGNAAKNQALSQRRAMAVKAYLMKKGVDGKILTAQGFGSSKPKFDPKTSSKEEWAQNRRVEFAAKMK